MAAAFFNNMVDPHKASAISAGTQPAPYVHPGVVEVMREAGIDLSGAKPQLLTEELAAGARLVVTMGCAEQCPSVPGLEVTDWAIEDPKGQPLERVRQIRDEVERRVVDLVEANSWAK